MRALSQLIPNCQDVLRLEPEQLAGVLLEILAELDGSDRQYFHRVQFCEYPDHLRGYPVTHGTDVRHAMLEAWMWLEREGFLVPRLNDSTGLWVDISRRGRRAAGRGGVDAYRHASMLPQTHLHPRIVAAVYPLYLRGEYDTAVFQAFKEVEVAVRDASAFTPQDIGCSLMRKAFDVKDGPLTDETELTSEKQSLSDLFAGAIGYFKNPSSHRAVAITPTRAVEAIMLASQLLGIVDARRSEGATNTD